jgi:type 1 glutamine amidotransferase
MNRREMLVRSGAVALAANLFSFPLGWTAPAGGHKKHILMYTRSQGFQHSVVTRKGNELSLAERIVTEMGKKHGFDVTCSKDGRIFEDKEFPNFDGFFFQTQGNLMAERSRDGQPPMSAAGKKALLDAIAGGKGFAGCHCASDTYHSKGGQWVNQAEDKRDPYIRMVGGEFIRHGAQQKATMHVVDHKFPGFKDLKDFQKFEEWYSLKNFAPDLHVLLVQETMGMKNFDYERPPFPATWAHKYHKGRVFYTSMGHREDVWESPIYQQILLGGISWMLGNVDADITPNMAKVAAHGSELPQQRKKSG